MQVCTSLLPVPYEPSPLEYNCLISGAVSWPHLSFLPLGKVGAIRITSRMGSLCSGQLNTSVWMKVQSWAYVMLPMPVYNLTHSVCSCQKPILGNALCCVWECGVGVWSEFVLTLWPLITLECHQLPIATDTPTTLGVCITPCPLEGMFLLSLHFCVSEIGM